MSTLADGRALVEALASYTGKGVYNPWRDYDADYDATPEAPAIRRNHLERYLAPRLGRSPYIVIAEAVGYQGGRFTGIAMTCERMLLGHHPHTGPEAIFGPTFTAADTLRTSRTDSPYITKDTQRKLGFNEPTDTVVWGAIQDAGLSPFDVILWNMFPFHPFKAGDPLSNRTPTRAELEDGIPFLHMLLSMHGSAQLLAVGQKAATTLAAFGYTAHPLRHPANGGAGLYRSGFATYIAAHT